MRFMPPIGSRLRPELSAILLGYAQLDNIYDANNLNDNSLYLDR